MILLDVTATATAKQVLDLQFEIDKLRVALIALKPSTLKEIITISVPVLAIISSFLIGWFVPKRTFNHQREFELKKKEEDRLEKRSELYRKLYSEFAGTYTLFENTLHLMNHHNINACYFHYFSKYSTDVGNDKRGDDYMQRYKDTAAELTKESKLVFELQQKFLMIFAEYRFLNDSKEVTNEYRKITGVPFIYKFDDEFAKCLTDDAMKKYLEKLNIDARGYVVNSIMVILDAVSQVMIDEMQSELKLMNEKLK